MNLHFDFTQSATRESILSQIQAHLDAETVERVQALAQQAPFEKEHYHDMDEVTAAIYALPVSVRVQDEMFLVYGLLAQAEARVHGTSVAKTHFHEVGRAEGLRNVLEVCLAMEALAPELVSATAVQTGSGKILCAHGEMDIPAPATKVILDSGIPVCEEKLEGELCTPTSAAMIKHFVRAFS